MTNTTRREFLRRGAAVLAGSWLLSACGGQATPAPVAPTSPPASAVGETKAAPTPAGATGEASATPTPAAAGATSASTTGRPDLVVARGGDDPEELVRRALAALGGIEQFVHKGDDVIIKPNICVAYHSYEYAATTNPWVVATLVKLAKEAGAGRVRVMDYPFGGTPEEAYVKSGIQEQVLAAGGEMEIMSMMKFVATDIPQGVSLQKCDIYDDILKANVVINVPIAKNHSLARLTLGMKNLMGVIKYREAMHYPLGQRLADLTGRVRPALTIVDAVRILTSGGPTGGNLDAVKKLDTIIASADIVAADSYATTLFDKKPEDMEYIKVGAQMGLGRSDLKSLKIEEIAVGS